MKIFRLLSMLAALALVLSLLPAAALPASADDGGQEINRDVLYMPGEVVVGFAEGQTPKQTAAQAAALAGEVGAQVAEVSGSTALLRFAPDADVPALAEQLSGVGGVAYAEPNYIYWTPEENALGEAHAADEVEMIIQEMLPAGDVFGRRAVELSKTGQQRTLTMSTDQLRTIRRLSGKQSLPAFPSDPYWEDNWGWNYVEADLIWPDKAANPMVCVIDSGIDINHPDLKGRALNGRDFVNDNESPNVANDDNGHGTHVAGTIAAVMNNKKGIAGISTGKVLAVKVLTAQGWGTAFDIAQGIRYCADNPYVKVINMSLGGPPNTTEYNALAYAIAAKGKLVVAAAGNDSTSSRSYPAGWADDATIGGGLISVAAARPRYSDSYDGNGDGFLWVDTDGDDVEEDGERFYPNQCAASFSNYGAWVEMIAPGESILSTLPVSYNYYGKYFEGTDEDGDGYEWFDGTSMAAPHVAGAAARVWSVFPVFTNQQVAQRLWEMGDEAGSRWVTAMDPHMTDPSQGYNDVGYAGEAPYCWPNATKGPDYSMEEARYLNVARAMGRSALRGALWDAASGMPLEKAYVYAYAGRSLKDAATIGRDSPYFYLLNLPANQPLDIKINKRGYTSGTVYLISGMSIEGGILAETAFAFTGVPPKGNITPVLSWSSTAGDVDLHAWLPYKEYPEYPGGLGAVVGSGFSGHSRDVDVGDLSGFPRARWNREGGRLDWLEIESISIAPRPGYPTMPYYNQTSSDYYDFLVQSFSGGLQNSYMLFDLWSGGKIVGSVYKARPACPVGADWWHPGYMQFGTFTSVEPVDQCGTGAPPPTGVWPY